MMPFGVQFTTIILDNPKSSSMVSMDYYFLHFCIFPIVADFQENITSFVRTNF